MDEVLFLTGIKLPKMKSFRNLLFLVFTIYLFGCSSDGNQLSLVETDLMKYGAPFKIMAPDSVDITEEDNLVSTDIELKYGTSYDVLVQIQDAADNDYTRFLQEQKRFVESGTYFSKIVESDEQGFIYQNKVDSTFVNYGFRYLILQNDKEFIFQSGLIGTFDLEEIQMMYQAVKQ